MKKWKKIFLVMMSVAMLAVLFGCSAKNDVTSIDVDSLCSELLDKAEFEDELSAIDDAMIKKLYNIDDYVKAAAYISSGATAEEIAVFEFDSKEKATEGLKAATDRIDEQRADFESYIPKEIPKLDKAVVKRSGNYVIVCVSNSDAAEEIIAEYVK